MAILKTVYKNAKVWQVISFLLDVVSAYLIIDGLFEENSIRLFIYGVLVLAVNILIIFLCRRFDIDLQVKEPFRHFWNIHSFRFEPPFIRVMHVLLMTSCVVVWTAFLGIFIWSII